MTTPLADSYEFCRRLSRRAAKNFYFSFTGLPRDRFDAMCALYAYMRICDDIGDDESVPAADRLRAVDWWQSAVESVFESDGPIESVLAPPFQHETFDSGRQLLPAMNDARQRFSIPVECLTGVITGVRMDLETESVSASALSCRYETFDELANYCYHVAGVVGQCCIHVWGFEESRALDLAIDCGLAFQLTNILRDIAEDADNGRVYLPAEDLRRFDYPVQAIAERRNNDQFQALMKFEAERAAEFYERARQLFDCLEPTGKPILQAMMRIYEGLLHEIVRHDYDVYSRRVSVPTWRKLVIATGAAVRHRLHSLT